MAEAFLRRLLRVDNHVQSDEDQKCVICMEECGTMNQETGLLELAIRLPFCRHIVGSGCIAQWLHLNNTCPMCRHVFFPAQSRPYLEHSDTEDETDHGQTDRGLVLNGPISGILDFLGDMRRLCDDYCTQLSLQPGTSHIAGCLVANLLEPGPSSAILQYYSDEYVVAVSIYMASHLTGHARSAREISGVIDDVDGHEIRGIYHRLMSRRVIIDDGIRYELNEVCNIQTLSWPPHGNEMTARESELEAMTFLCSGYCVILSLPVLVEVIASKIVSRVWNITLPDQTPRSSESMAAACVYMAGHLTGSSRSLAAISQISRASEQSIGGIYHLLYAVRERILREHWLRYIGRDDMESALATLPTVLQYP